MTAFRGRGNDLALLDRQLRLVREAAATTPGQAVIVTGRRRVGKSRLVQEFCDRSGVPYVIFQASRGRNPVAERADFTATLAQSSLPGADLVADAAGTDWNHTLRALAVAASEQTPCVVVLDEVAWLVEQDHEFEGALQTVWDRYLSAKPVLLLLVGSDLSMMEALQEYGRPFHGRAARMLVRPLDPADVREMTELEPAEAIDAFLITLRDKRIVATDTPLATRPDTRNKRYRIADPYLRF
jgi:uncharacterized protein